MRCWANLGLVFLKSKPSQVPRGGCVGNVLYFFIIVFLYYSTPSCSTPCASRSRGAMMADGSLTSTVHNSADLRQRVGAQATGGGAAAAADGEVTEDMSDHPLFWGGGPDAAPTTQRTTSIRVLPHGEGSRKQLPRQGRHRGRGKGPSPPVNKKNWTTHEPGSVLSRHGGESPN